MEKPRKPNREDVNKCRECYSGRIPDPPNPDPVEGFKMAGWRNCPICGGTGILHKTVANERYKEKMDQYALRKAQWENWNNTYKSAMSKLTKQEKKALGVI